MRLTTILHSVTVRSYDKRRLGIPGLLISLQIYFILYHFCYVFIYSFWVKSTNSGALNSIHRLHANLGSRFQASLFLDSICTTPPAVVAETLSQHTQKFVHSSCCCCSCCCLHILYEQGKPGEHFLQSTIHTKSYNKRIFGLFLL